MESKIKKIMSEIFNEEITEDFSKFTTDKWDSFMQLDLIVRIEQEFNISFTPDEIGEISSYKDLVKVVNEKI